jgi:hypothetical protein
VGFFILKKGEIKLVGYIQPCMFCDMKKTKLDNEVTFLVVEGSQYSIEWAGCLYGPSDKLEDICKGDLLALAKAKLADSSTIWQKTEFVDYDDGLGPVDIAEAVVQCL